MAAGRSMMRDRANLLITAILIQAASIALALTRRPARAAAALDLPARLRFRLRLIRWYGHRCIALGRRIQAMS